MIGIGIRISPRTSGTSATVVTATVATGIGITSFTANWNAFSGAQYYLLDVSTSSSFATFVFQDQVVAATSYVVTGLTPNTVYYYRVRASTDAPPITATGGTITFSGGRTIHTFNSSGTFTVLTAPSGATVEALVVAGGGGGGNYAGGGGGAGGLLYDSAKSISVSAYAITVGSGGVVSPQQNTLGTNGNNSVFDTLIAIGGGAGSVQTVGGQNGGSGGGGGAFGVAAPGAGTSGQGFGGGVSFASPQTGGAGGGGASQVGANATATNNGGNGGNGLAYSISGTSTYYAGGGGGAAENPGVIGNGGSGGGGAGGLNSGGLSVSGAANTGGGGGGMWYTNGSPTGNGGSGIVIISYPT